MLWALCGEENLQSEDFSLSVITLLVMKFNCKINALVETRVEEGKETMC